MTRPFLVGAFTLAATHVSPPLTIIPACVVLGVIAWYWWRLGRPGVPASRRRIRRWSMVLMVLELPLLVAGFSYVDGDVEHARYVLVWSAAFTLLLAIFVTAIVDALNNLRLHARQADQEAVQAAGELVRALKVRQARKPRAAGRGEQPARRRSNGGGTSAGEAGGEAGAGGGGASLADS